MLGAIIGDICGSIYEFDNRKTVQPETIDLRDPSCAYTDDSVLTCAVAEAAFGDRDYAKAILTWARRYPRASYGYNFRRWFTSENQAPYNSYGNGSAMRVSAVGWAFPTLEETLTQARYSAECTHNHPEGVKGAQATAAAIFLARTGSTKAAIKSYIAKEFGYDLDRALDKIRPAYLFDESCQGTVPEALIAFLESRDFTHAIQCAISIGGDSDTLAAITGSVAEAFYAGKPPCEMPQALIDFAASKITPDMQAVLDASYLAKKA
jgi:ADP-ribosylglycohydrolase